MKKGILSDDIVKRTLQYLEDEKEVRNLTEIKFIMEVFPNAKIVSYRRKDNGID